MDCPYLSNSLSGLVVAFACSRTPVGSMTASIYCWMTNSERATQPCSLVNELLAGDCRSRFLDHPIDRKTKVFQEIFDRRRRTETVHADVSPLVPCIPFPAEGRSHLHRHTRCDIRWQNTLSVSRILLVEDFLRRHADHARLDAFSLQLFVRINTKR